MKKHILALLVILLISSTSTVFARGFYHGYPRDYRGYRSYHHWHPGYSGYNGYYSHHRHHDNHDDLGIALAVIGGVILVSALMNIDSAPPQNVIYDSPYRSDQSYAVTSHPGICFVERKVSGELQVNGVTGQQEWISFPYPLTRKVQVPCYFE